MQPSPDPLKGVVDLPDAARRLESELETYMEQKDGMGPNGFLACFRLALRMSKKAGMTLPELQQATADAWPGITIRGPIFHGSYEFSPLRNITEVSDAARELEKDLETYMTRIGTLEEYGVSACFRLAIRMAKKGAETLADVQQATADAWKAIPGTDKVLT